MTRPTLWILPAFLALAPAALAQGGTANITQESVEIAPFAGLRTGGSLSGELDGAPRDFAIQSGTSYGGTLDFFSLSLGGGLKFFPARHVGLRFDARAYMTFIKSDTGAFCVNGTCILAYSGSHLWQGDFTGGLILAF